MGIFKPDPKVYQMVLDHLVCRISEVLFVSSNGWDIAGASQFGFKTLWINRLNLPVDRLPFSPDSTGVDLNIIKTFIN